MKSKKYEFTARGKLNTPRPRLMSEWTLAGFAVVVLIPLVMTFPKQELLRQAARGKLGDALSISYLTNMIKADPKNLELRVLLAEHKIFLGETEKVFPIIEPLLQSDDKQWQLKGRLLEYKSLEWQASHAAKGSPRQLALEKQRHAAFIDLARHAWSTDALVYLAGQATDLHEKTVAALLFRSISDVSWQESSEWFAEAAYRVLGEGEYELAAHLYFIARQKAYSLPKKRKYLMAGINALMANSMFNEAMRAADQYLGDLEDDPETLYLLAQAARAANDMVRADRYAREMLRLSWLDRTLEWLQRIDLSPIPTANAATGDPVGEVPDGMRPYDKKTYLLAYEIFVGNHNLADAYRVAEAAVRQVPAEVEWHKRLAQVAEWSGKQAVALREWLWMLHHNGGEEAMLAILRLAPGLGDNENLLDAWKRLATVRTLDEAQWNVVAGLFEQTGRQKEGVQYFVARYDIEHKPVLLEIAARMAQRNGNDDYAFTLYSRLIRNHGFKPEWALRIASIYLQKGQYDKAFEILQKGRGKVQGKDVEYWQMLGDLAWQLQHDTEAERGYRNLAASGDIASEQISRLIYLFGETRKEEVAALAELAYRKYGDRGMLLRALEIHAAQHDLASQKRLFESITEEGMASLRETPRFYLLRARYLLAIGRFQEARADFHRAADLAPDDFETVNSILWFLVDAHDQAGLREVLTQITSRGDQQNPAYWGALAAAYQVLDQPALAVAYYSHQIDKKGQDFLWLVNFADALEQNQQAGMAMRVRQHAWLQLRDKQRDKKLGLPFTPEMLAAARMALMNQPGDPSLALVRSILRQDRLAERDVVNDSQTSELILGWAASKEESSNAKAWLWQRYGATLNRPLWGETMVAFAENDTERIERLLAEQADAMPMLGRHDAARALEQTRYAQSIVFEGLEANPYSNEAHQRLTEDALDTASFVQFGMRNVHLGTLHSTVTSTQIETPVASNVRLGAEFWRAHQANDVTPLFGNVPPVENVGGVALKIHGGAGDTEINVRRRNEFAKTVESRVNHAMNLQPGVYLQLGGEMHAEATESNDLRVFGMRNQAEATLLYRFSKREYLQVQPAYAYYYIQNGDRLGRGERLSWEIGHHIRGEYPDWTLRLTGIHTRFQSDAATVLPLPGPANLFGLCTGFGETARNNYSQAWRPYFSYCATRNDVSGGGYNTHVGIGGSVAGHDVLSLSFMQELGGASVVNGLTRELAVNYRYYFDRY